MLGFRMASKERFIFSLTVAGMHGHIQLYQILTRIYWFLDFWRIVSISFKFQDRSVVVGSAKGVGRFHLAEMKTESEEFLAI